MRGSLIIFITNSHADRYSFISIELMKIRIYILILFLAIVPLTMHAQVEFLEVKTLEEMKAAQQQASDQMLMLFVDVYATWCGPCKMMDREVYTDPAVADYMNTHFVNVRLDGECDYGRTYVEEEKLEGYPSMFIFSDEAERVSTIIGFTPPEELIPSLERAVEGFRKVKIFRAKHIQGSLEPEEFVDYINVVRNMGNQEEADRLGIAYMEKMMDPKLSDNDIGVVAFHMDIDNAWWADFSSDPDRLKRVLEDDYMLAMEKIYNLTLVKAVEEDRIDLISRMAHELVPLVEEESSSWDLRTLPFIQYYYYTDQTDELIAYIDQRFASDRMGDHRWLYSAASQITDMDQQYLTESLLRKELEWYTACLEMEEHFDYYFYQGMVLFFLQETERAKDTFLKAEALALTTEQQEMITQVMGFINSK